MKVKLKTFNNSAYEAQDLGYQWSKKLKSNSICKIAIMVALYTA